MVRIYIRHAEKAYTNGNNKTHKHDPGLTPEGVEAAVSMGHKLTTTLGPPTYIITSPYRRCRETAEALLEGVKAIFPEHHVTILCDVRLSEFLGHHPQEPLDVTPETYTFKPPHPETMRQFEQRVHSHYTDLSSLDSIPGAAWLVTHGIVINHVARLACGLRRLRLPPLGGIHIARSVEGLNVQRIDETPLPCINSIGTSS